MYSLEDLPDFLITYDYDKENRTHHGKKIFEDDKENEKFIKFSEKFGKEVIEKTINCCEISKGFENYLTKLKDHFLFSISKDWASDSRAREILEDFLEINDRYSIVINDDDLVFQALENNDIFIVNQKKDIRFNPNTSYVFYLGKLTKKDCNNYKEERKLNLFQILRKKIDEKSEDLKKYMSYGFEGFNADFESIFNKAE